MKFKKFFLNAILIALLTFTIFALTALFFENVSIKNSFVLLSKRLVAETAAFGVKHIYDPFKRKHKFPLFCPSKKIYIREEDWISDKISLNNFIVSRLQDKLAIVEYNNQPIIRSFFEFYYQPYNEKKLSLLKETYHLDKIVKNSKDEYDSIIKLKNWVSSRWKIGVAKRVPYNFDALQILKRVEQGERFFCSEYSTVFVQVALSLGFNARYVGLFKGHVVAEVWLNQFNKWIVMDPTFNIRYMLEGVPLNSLELHNLWCKGGWNKVKVIVDEPQPKNLSISNFQYKLIDFYDSFYIRMRNDWFTNQYPHWYPLSSSIMNGLEWKDKCATNSIAVSRETFNPADLYWTLNRTTIKLKPKNISDHNIDFDVYLVTFTPNFKNFIVKIDSENIIKENNPFFIWSLHRGVNVLSVKSVNEFGVEGIESKIVLALNN